MDEQTPKVEISPIEAEFNALQRIVDQKFTNPLKLKKFIFKIQPEHPEYLQKRLFRWLLSASKPIFHLQDTYNLISEYMAIIPQLREDGYHGFLVFNSEIFPVKLDNDDEMTYKLYDVDYKFTEEEESDIMNWMIDDWEQAQGKTFKGMVALIWEYGFSGLGQNFG